MSEKRESVYQILLKMLMLETPGPIKPVCGNFLYVCMCKCVHYLVDLVHHSEGAAVELLQGHEVEHCGDAALSSALMVGRQLVELSAAVKLHPDSDPILVILLLR